MKLNTKMETKEIDGRKIRQKNLVPFGANGKISASEAGRIGGSRPKKKREVRIELSNIINNDEPLGGIQQIAQAMKEHLRLGNNAKALALRSLLYAFTGDDIGNLNSVIEHHEGKLEQRHVVAGDPDNPLTMLHVPITEEERLARINDLLGKVRSRRLSADDAGGEGSSGIIDVTPEEVVTPTRPTNKSTRK